METLYVMEPGNQILGRIYKLTSPQTEKVYIGSTTQTLHARLADHRKDYTRYINGKIAHLRSCDIMHYGDIQIELMFEGLVDHRHILNKMEGEFIQSHPNCTNDRVSGRSSKEYYDQNVEHILKYKKKYRAEHKDTTAENNHRCYERTRDSILAQKKEYYKQNLGTINARTKEILSCEVCGSNYTRGNKSQHLKSQKHKDANDK
jgi:uncharacterized protein with PIN domain